MIDAIRVENLSKKYKGFQLQDVSFRVPMGCVVGLIGENGAGKSTTIKALLNLIHKDGGFVEVLGTEVGDRTAGFREEIGVVFEGNHFHELLSWKQISAILGGIYRNWDEELFEQYMQRFGLPVKKKVKDYSTGMVMKLNLAAALAHHPRLLILDEATSGLDPVVRDEILDLFFEFIEDEEHAILMSSHITSDLEKVADYIAMIHEGRLLFMEEKDRLLDDLGVVRCGGEDLEELKEEQALYRRSKEYATEVLVKDKEGVRRRHPALLVDDTGIEEIMLFYTKGEAVC